MLPDEHLDDLENAVRKKKIYKVVSSFFLFAASYLFLAPLVHETVHMLVLTVSNCFYETSWSFNILTGLRGSVEPHCSLNSMNQAVFYVSGYLVTFFAAVATLYSSKQFERFKIQFLAVSSGFLLSLVGNVSLRGDLESLRLLLNASELLSWAIFLGVIAACFILILELYEA